MGGGRLKFLKFLKSTSKTSKTGKGRKIQKLQKLQKPINQEMIEISFLRFLKFFSKTSKTGRGRKLQLQPAPPRPDVQETKLTVLEVFSSFLCRRKKRYPRMKNTQRHPPTIAITTFINLSGPPFTSCSGCAERG
eukprot:sb/3474703/